MVYLPSPCSLNTTMCNCNGDITTNVFHACVPLLQVLERAGCVFQERHGWERPGWFNTEPAPVQKYDWYESYNQAANEDQRYVQALQQDYSFDFPKNHDRVCDVCLDNFEETFMFSLSTEVINDVGHCPINISSSRNAAWYSPAYYYFKR